MKGLQLNFLEIKFNKEDISLPTLTYQNKDWYLRLKKDNEAKIFKREARNIYYWNRDLSQSSLIEDAIFTSVNYNDNPSIFCRIIESALVFNLSKIKGYDIWLDKYSNAWKVQKNINLYNDDSIAVYRVITFNTYFNFYNGKKNFGIVVNSELKTRFIKTKEQLEKAGFDTRGLNSKDNIIFANKKALTRYFESTQTNEKYYNFIKEQTSNSIEYAEINKFNTWIIKTLSSLELFENLKVVYCKTNIIPNDNEVFLTNNINKPIRYYCDDEKVPYGNRLFVNDAIQKFKPYNYSLLKENYNIAVLFPAENQGIAEDFVKKVEKRLIETFHIKKVNFSYLIASKASVEDYKEAIYSKDLQNIDLAIIIVLDKFKNEEDINSPYLLTKAKFLSREIPTQEVRLETILGSAVSLQYTLNNIALNIFAKLGGIPWVVEKTDNLRQEFIVGISSTINRENKKIFGVATVFDFNGKYYQADCVPLASFNTFEDKEEYTKKIQSTVKYLLEKIDITNKDIRFIFHLTKSPSNKYEIKAINNVLQNYKNYNVQYAFVKIGYYHNFRLFKDEGKQNVFDGQYLRISNNEALVQFKGKDKLPVRFTLHQDSTFRDLFSLAKQIYWFAFLSYRSYNPARKPVTTLYPWLITSLLEKMKNIEGWDKDIIRRMEDKLWFI